MSSNRLLQSAILTRQGERGPMFRHTHIIANPNYRPGDVLNVVVYQTKRVEAWTLVFAGGTINEFSKWVANGKNVRQAIIEWWDKPASEADAADID